MNFQNDFICPRLIDYIVIVGLRADQNHSNNSKGITPEILRRYPPTDHLNSYLPNDVVYFCQPEGCYKKITYRNELNQPHGFVFSLTEKETGCIRFCICLNFYRTIRKQSSLKINKFTEDYYNNFIMKTSQIKRTRKKRYSLTSMLIISHHPFFRGFEECLYVLKGMIDRLDKNVKKRNSNSDSIWSALFSSSKEDVSPHLHQMIVEIETWIFKLLSAPVPVPGITKIKLSLLPETAMKPLTFALPGSDRLPLVDFSLQRIFDSLGVEFALKIFIAVLLECKVLLQSSNYVILSTTVLAAKHLLYPLEYMFPVIPILPSHMPMSEQLIMAPSPFIFGISANFLSARKSFRLPDDVWLFDLDNKMYTNNGSSTLLPHDEMDEDLSLPSASDFDLLVKQIKQVMNAPKKNKYESMSSFSDLTDFSEVPSYKSGFLDLSSAVDDDLVDVSIRVTMIRFLNSPHVMGDYNKYTRVLKLFPRPIVAFQMDNFLKGCKCQSDFISKLLQTQAVEFFGEWSITSKSSVFSKIIMENCDPRVIGDKAKWFDQALAVIPFRVCSDCRTCALYNIINCDSNGDFYSEKSETDCENGSDTSILSIEVTENGNDRNDSGISGCQIHSAEVGKIYRPPTNLQVNLDEDVEDLPFISSSRSCSKDNLLSDSDEIFIKNDDEDCKSHSPMFTLPSKQPLTSQKFTAGTNSSSQITSDSESMASVSIISESFGKHYLPRKSSTNNLKNIYNKIISNTSRNISELLSNDTSAQKPSLNSELLKSDLRPRSKYMKKSIIQREDLTNRIKEAHSQSRSTSNLFFPEMSESDRTFLNNQEFIHKVTDELLRGDYPNILRRYKFKDLVEKEKYRNLILSKISRNLDSNFRNNRHVDDVMTDTEDQFNALVWICKTLINGIEESYKKGVREGYGSVFVLLEMIHTHYTEIRRRGSVMSNSSSMSDSLTEPSKVMPNSPNVVVMGSLGEPVNVNGEEYEMIDAVYNQRDYYVVKTNEADITDDEGSSTYSSRNKLECFLDACSNSVIRQNPFDFRSETSSVVSAHEPGINNLPFTNETYRNSEARKYRYFNNQLYCYQNSEQPTFPTFKHGRTHQSSISSKFSRNSRPNPDTMHIPTLIIDVIDKISQKNHTTDQNKQYLYQNFVSEKDRSPLWDNITFWEDAFYDSVCQEREILGMDHDPKELLDRYKSMELRERKRLERNEDKLLGIAIHNLVALMLLMKVDIIEIKLMARRLTAKSHITLEESRNIEKLTDALKYLEGNGINLLVTLSRLQKVKTFSVYYGNINEGDVYIAEVCKDCLILRTMTGNIVERWWLDMFIKCTCKGNTICISRMDNHKIVMTNLYCKNSKELIEAVQSNSQRFMATEEIINSRFNVTDDETCCGGLLNISKDGLTFVSKDYEWFVNIIHVKKCYTRKPDRFVVEIMEPNSKVITNKVFKSYSYNQIAQRMLTLFSILSTEVSTPPVTPSEVRYGRESDV